MGPIEWGGIAVAAMAILIALLDIMLLVSLVQIAMEIIVQVVVFMVPLAFVFLLVLGVSIAANLLLSVVSAWHLLFILLIIAMARGQFAHLRDQKLRAI